MLKGNYRLKKVPDTQQQVHGQQCLQLASLRLLRLVTWLLLQDQYLKMTFLLENMTAGYIFYLI